MSLPQQQRLSNSPSEPLHSSLSVATDDHDRQSDAHSAGGGGSGSPTTSTDRPLSENLSTSRLNAKAPEFVPWPSSSHLRLMIPQQPPPPGLVQVYTSPNSPYGVPIPNHVPVAVAVQNNHPPYAHHLPVQYHPHPHHHHRQFYGGGRGCEGGGYVDHQEVAVVQATRLPQHAPSHDSDYVFPLNNNGLSDEAAQKIINQVEYYFSDVNLATTDHLMRYISKDPEGYVPISVVASFKKIKALTNSNSQLASILRNSEKLVISEDGKKVRRQHPFTEANIEELQSRIVVAENLPEDHCHQNLMKIFSAVGSVKTIRTCQPQTSNGGTLSASRTAKAEGMFFCNKLHAFVEYESVELAEKAFSELNDEGNWRNGLKVRLLLRCTAKSAPVRAKKVGHEGEANCKGNDASTSEKELPNENRLEDLSQQTDAQSNEHTGEEHCTDKEGGQRKGRSRGWGKGRGRPQYHHNHRGSHVGTPPNNSVNNEHLIVAKQPPGPRMPDGTRGFSMGRGKPVAANIG